VTETAPLSTYAKGRPRLHYLAWPHAGEASALLIHGSFGNAHIWSHFAPGLAAQMSVIAPNLRGHGASDWPPDGDYSLEALVDDMDRVLANSAQSGALVLVAHSLGNIIATKLAARHRERLRALVLVDHALRVEPDHRDHLVEAGSRAPREFRTLEEGLAWARRLAGGAAADPDILSGMAEANVVADGPAYRQAFDQGFLASLTIWDSEPEMRLIEAPVLIVRAGLQPVLREPAARRMLAGFANAELVTILDAGHNVFMERPAEFEKVVLGFLDRAGSNRP